MPTIGILFDIEGLGGGLYGFSAYKAFFAAVDTRLIPGSVLADGDTNATLAGQANHYCISVMSDDVAALGRVREAMTRSTADGLLPVGRRFLDDAAVRREPLVPAAQVDARGQLVNAKPRWIAEAWQATAHTGAPQPVPASMPAAVPAPLPATRLPATPGTEALVPRELSFTDLFDRTRFGVNVWVGVALLAATVFEMCSWMVPPLLSGASVGVNGPAYYLVATVFAAIEAALFVLLVHTVRRPGPLVLWWVVVAVVRGVLWRATFRLVPEAPWGHVALFDAGAVLRAAVYGASFMGGLVLAVRAWKVTPKAFVAGGIATTIVPMLLMSRAVVISPAGFMWSSLLLLVVNGSVLGALLYAAVWHQLKRRGLRFAVATDSAAAAAFGAAVDGPLDAPRRAAGVVGAAGAAASGETTFYYICSGNPSLISAFADLFAVAEQAGWGHAERARISRSEGTLVAARRRAAEHNELFSGSQYLGESREAVQRLDDLISRLQAEHADPLHVLAAQVVDAHAGWVHEVYTTLLKEAAGQGILPFRMYTTKRAEAGRALARLLSSG